MTTKVTSEVKSFRDGQVGEILVAEGYDFALCYVACEFILAGVGEGA